MAIELPATQRSENTTARPMMRIIPFKSPSISSNILPNASSVWVRIGIIAVPIAVVDALAQHGHVIGGLALDEDHARVARAPALADVAELELATTRLNSSSK